MVENPAPGAAKEKRLVGKAPPAVAMEGGASDKKEGCVPVSKRATCPPGGGGGPRREARSMSRSCRGQGRAGGEARALIRPGMHGPGGERERPGGLPRDFSSCATPAEASCAHAGASSSSASAGAALPDRPGGLRTLAWIPCDRKYLARSASNAAASPSSGTKALSKPDMPVPSPPPPPRPPAEGISQ
jgi:hypothetical protein